MMKKISSSRRSSSLVAVATLQQTFHFLCLVLLLVATTSVVNGQTGCGSSGDADYTVVIKTGSGPGHSFESTICFEDGVGCTTSSNTTNDDGYGVLSVDFVNCPSPEDGIESISIQNDGVDPLPIHYIQLQQNGTDHDVLYRTCFEEVTCGTLAPGSFNETICVAGDTDIYESITLKEGTYVLYTLDTKSLVTVDSVVTNFQEVSHIDHLGYANETCGDSTGSGTARQRSLTEATTTTTTTTKTNLRGWEEEEGR